jgi:hypothetical protein
MKQCTDLRTGAAMVIPPSSGAAWILRDRMLPMNGASLPMHTAHVLLTSSLCGRRLNWLDVVVHTEKVCRIVLDF